MISVKCKLAPYMYRCSHNLLPDSFNNMFNTNANNHNYATRNSTNFEFPKSRILNFIINLFHTKVLRPGINIPKDVQKSKTIKSFKYSYKKNPSFRIYYMEDVS